MTLREVELERPARIVRIERLSEAERLRLSGMGLREGMPIVKLLRVPLRDPIECLVGPQLMTLESWLMDHIVVSAA